MFFLFYFIGVANIFSLFKLLTCKQVRNNMQTALKLGRKGWARYLKSGKHRTAQTQLSSSELIERKQLLSRIQKAAHEIKSRYSVRRIVLFGSLAHEGWFASDSDVDIAVEGLQGDDYWRAWRVAEETIGDRPVDLIEIESSSEALRQAIENYGIDL
jgi:predicted nucleotidyltransferase